MVASREKILAGWLIDGSGRPPEKDMVLTMQAYIEYMPSEAGRQSRLQNGKGALSPVEGAQRNLAHQLEQMALARQLGVRVAVGTDAGSPGVDHGKSLRAEIGLLIRAGYSIPEAMMPRNHHQIFKGRYSLRLGGLVAISFYCRKEGQNCRSRIIHL